MAAARIEDGLTLTTWNLESDSDGDDGDHGNEGYMKCEEAFEEEANEIARLNAKREPDGRCTRPFALAFSGGGMRAAAFEAGVLWRLAEADRLKDVEYFAAVSGGGYITTAFASHCLEAGLPERGQVRDWYLQVVAKTLCRMQHNAGNFVRDCVKDPGGPTDGNGLLPRIFDVPILVGILLFHLLAGLVFSFCLFVLVSFNVDQVWGLLLRTAFCAHDRHLLVKSPLYTRVIWSIVAMLCMQLLLYIVRRVVPTFARPRAFKPGEKRPRAPRLYVLGHATAKVLMRGVIYLMAACAILPIMVLGMEHYEYGNVSLFAECSEYMKELQKSHSCNGLSGHTEDWVCNVTLLPDERNTSETKPAAVDGSQSRYTMVTKLALLALVAVVVLVINVPVIGAMSFARIITNAIPCLTCFFFVQMSQITVFIRITENRRGLLPWLGPETWNKVVLAAICFFLFAVPFYDKIRSIFHIYYKRTLQSNFFAGGKDPSITELRDNPYIPFIILSGSTTDYQPPGDDDNISELTFSPLHCGGEETGYVGMPPEMTLAKCAALSGAAPDNIALVLFSTNFILRFYHELLIPNWGAYVMFGPRVGRCDRNSREHVGAVPWIVVLALQLIAYHNDSDKPSCFALLSVLLGFIIVGLSFYNFVPVLDTITFSWIARLYHQTTSYLNVGNRPPSMLYVTDGGGRDCTAICQLLHRKCERILLVLAASDPEDELRVLRDALDMALGLKLASVYDFDDLAKSLSVTFEEFKEDTNKPFLRLGISYCFAREQKHGLLIIVKNRLPDSQKEQPMKALLTEETITGEESDESESELGAFSEMNLSQLGSPGCCDCCHTRGLNCGTAFPHGINAHTALCLSPQFCNNLMRLGHDISGKAVDAITSLPLRA